MMPQVQELPSPIPLTGLPDHQKWVAIATAFLMLATVLELVRRRKLREELSALWIGTGLVLLLLAFWPRLLGLFQSAIGAQMPTSALFFGALVFLMAVSLLVSVLLSRLTFRNKALAQEVALRRREIEELGQEVTALRRELDSLRAATAEVAPTTRAGRS